MTRFLHISSAAVGSVAVACIVFAGAVPGAASAAARTPAAAAVQVAAARMTLPAYVPAKRTLEYGMHGNDVRALQQRLAQLKYYPGAADGQFGADTLEAVWAFQEVQGLSADGIVGPLTRARAGEPPRSAIARSARRRATGGGKPPPAGAPPLPGQQAVTCQPRLRRRRILTWCAITIAALS